MKKIIAFLLSLSFLFTFVGCSNPLKNKKEADKQEKVKEIVSIDTKNSMKGITLKVGVSPDFAPFTYQDEKSGEMKGFDIDYLEEVSQYLGFDYVLVTQQMSKIEKDLKEGKLDCAITGISVTDSRQKNFKFTDTYFENSLTLMKNKKVEASTKKDIVHMKIGVEKGTASDEYVKNYLEHFNNKIKHYKNMTKVLKALEKGKIDASIFDTTGVEYYVKNPEDSNIEVVEKNLNEEQSSYAIMCNKKFKYIDEFNVAMKQIELDGKYQEIYNKWFQENLQD